MTAMQQHQGSTAAETAPAHPASIHHHVDDSADRIDLFTQSHTHPRMIVAAAGRNGLIIA